MHTVPGNGGLESCFHVTLIVLMSLLSTNSLKPESAFRAGLAAVLALCCVLFVFFSRHWPLIGDATLVHYLVLLLDHGFSPYRTIVDAQMPGTYLLDWGVVHFFGGGAVGLRVFDFTLLALAALAMLWITWPWDRFAGFFAAALFALLHGRDGIPQTSQRDLIMAVLMLLAVAAAFHAVRRSQSGWMFLFGFCTATATSIKPTAAPVALLLILAAIVLRRNGRPLFWYMAWGIVGLILPCLAVALFLIKERSIPAFLQAIRGMWPYYATLDNRPWGYLLRHSISPLLFLVLLWMMLLLLKGIRWRKEPAAPWHWERFALWMGLALGFFSYLSQRKGYPYHRYPVLAFLLLLMALDFSDALRRHGVLRLCGIIGLAAGALIIAPMSVYKISTYDWRYDQLFTMLRSDLQHEGGASLSGHVQCLDTSAGCINALYRMKLVESTGFLVDFYFWAPRQTPVTEQMRRRFWTALQENPPKVFVVMKQDFPNGPDTYDKITRWPEFANYLSQDYTLAADRVAGTWVKRESRSYPPTSYRIYVRKTEAAPPA